MASSLTLHLGGEDRVICSHSLLCCLLWYSGCLSVLVGSNQVAAKSAALTVLLLFFFFYVHWFAGAFGGLRLKTGIFLNCSPPHVLRQGLSLNLMFSPIHLDRAPPVLSPIAPVLQVSIAMPSFLHGYFCCCCCYCVGFRDQIQVIKLGIGYIYPLSHFIASHPSL